MTREEAIKIWNANAVVPVDEAISAKIVDAFSALGILKLDEPPSVKSRFRKAVAPIGQGVVGQWSENIWECVHLSGLKIVEK